MTTIPFLRGARFAALCLCATTLAAQSLPVPDSRGRMVQLFDLEGLHGALQPAAKNPLAPADDERPAQRFARLVRSLIEPPLGDGDDLAVVGDRWLVVLARPAQVASVDKLFATARARQDQAIDIEVQLSRVEAARFAESIQPRLHEVRVGQQLGYEAALDAAAAKQLVAALVDQAIDRIQCPQVAVLPLRAARVETLERITYMKDFEVVRVGEQMIADPVLAEVWDGIRIDVLATFVDGGALGVVCDVTFQDVEKPIAEHEVKLGKDFPAKIQLPRVTGTRLQQTAVLADGGMAVVARRKVDGDWLVALVSARGKAK